MRNIDCVAWSVWVRADHQGTPLVQGKCRGPPKLHSSLFFIYACLVGFGLIPGLKESPSSLPERRESFVIERCNLKLLGREEYRQ